MGVRDVIEVELDLYKHGRIINDEDKCLLSKLALAFTIPSFCSKYIYDHDPDKNYGRYERERYTRWCDDYLEFTPLSSKECYAARCSLLHHGDDDLETQPVLAGETIANKYILSIPYSSDELYLVKTADNEYQKSFCSNSLITNLTQAYRKFKEEYPDFVYPLQRIN
ncbi:MAG: hypothetical protein ACLSWV_01545 [Pygmaiobacter massiliensis]